MSVGGAITQILMDYARDLQMMSLSGTGHWHTLDSALCNPEDDALYDCMGYNPIDKLKERLRLGIIEIDAFERHVTEAKHLPNENGICMDCGWDLNA